MTEDGRIQPEGAVWCLFQVAPEDPEQVWRLAQIFDREPDATAQAEKWRNEDGIQCHVQRWAVWK